MICATKVTAKELGKYNIRVNAIAPGLTETDMMIENTPKDALAQALQRTSMKRVTTEKVIEGLFTFWHDIYTVQGMPHIPRKLEPSIRQRIARHPDTSSI